MSSLFVRRVKLTNFLSFGPETPPLEFEPLNVLIGPNGSGKSNLIEAFELLRAAPHDLTAPLRDGGGAGEWLWKGTVPPGSALIEARLSANGRVPELRYFMEFGQTNNRLAVLKEVLEEGEKRAPEDHDVPFYYRYLNGTATLNARQFGKPGAEPLAVVYSPMQLPIASVNPEQSVFSQRRDPDLYPELTSSLSDLGGEDILE